MKKWFKKFEGIKTKVGAALMLAAPFVAQVRPDVGAVVLVAGKILSGVGIADQVARTLYAPKYGA